MKILKIRSYLYIITPFAFIIETVYSVNTCTFVISTEKEKVFWISEKLKYNIDIKKIITYLIL